MQLDIYHLLKGEPAILDIAPEVIETDVLLECGGYQRVDQNITEKNYPINMQAYLHRMQVTKNGQLEDPRKLVMLFPGQAEFREINNFSTLYEGTPAHLYDCLHFVIKYSPYFRYMGPGAMIGFPGIVRENCTEKYFPLLGISSEGRFLIEVNIKLGWSKHWALGFSPKSRKFFHPSIYQRQ